jgi:hypothetical protein
MSTSDEDEEFDSADFSLTPGEIAAADQYGAMIRDKPPVPVPYIPLFKLMNRYHRLKRLRAIGAPFAENEWKLIEEALEEISSFTVGGGLVDLPGEPSAGAGE